MDFAIVLLVLGIFAALVFGYLIGNKIACIKRDRFWEGEIEGHRRDAIARSRAVLSGQFSEQMAPYFPGFQHKPGECKFLGKPVDLICFEGLDEKNVKEIVFIEVKSRNAKLSPVEKQIKEAVEDKRVRWEEYRVQGDL